jgi:hypothetical protein
LLGFIRRGNGPVPGKCQAVQFSLNITAGIDEGKEGVAAGPNRILAQLDSPRTMSVGRKAVIVERGHRLIH